MQRRGYTLVELMVAIAIVIVISAIAVPNLALSIQRQRLQNVSSSFISSIGKVRENAILDQKDLRVYFPITGIRSGHDYYIEYYQKDPIHNVHYTPIDAPDGHRFVLVSEPSDVEYSFSNGTTPATIVTVNGVQYAYLTLYCGADIHFRGQINSNIPVELLFALSDSSRSITVTISLAGRASVV